MDAQHLEAQLSQDLALLEEQLVKRAFFARLGELGHQPATPEAAEAAWEVGLYLQQLPEDAEVADGIKQASVGTDPYALGAEQLAGLFQNTPVAEVQRSGEIKQAAAAAQAIPGVSEALQRLAALEAVALQQVLAAQMQQARR